MMQMRSCGPILFFAATLPLWPAGAQAGATTRASVSGSGQEANNISRSASISADSRFVAFWSYASNLVPDDTNGRPDVFVHDRLTGQTSRVSVSSDGLEGNENSYYPSISADGRFVAFYSAASNLVPDDTNGHWDVFVRDRQTGETTRASVSSNGEQGYGGSFDPSISADGRYVAFWSLADNLVPGDTNQKADIFVRDRVSGETTRVSVSSDGEESNLHSGSPSISADGRFVAFDSYATNLVPGDTNARSDVFVHDRETGQTARLSISGSGQQGNDGSYVPSISAAGRFVAFYSSASNLVPEDTNGYSDVFVHDAQTGQTIRVSVSNDGAQANRDSEYPSISADGRSVAFWSYASNLVPGDTNAKADVFVRERRARQTARVSVSGSGEEGNSYSLNPSISADGRSVAFHSAASNLVPGDTNGREDVFVHQAGDAALPGGEGE
jgi:Tol biopolymer transport system component